MRNYRRHQQHRSLKRVSLVLLFVVLIGFAFFLYRSFISPYSFRLKAIAENGNFPPGEVRGLDISHYQQEIDWDKVGAATLGGRRVGFVFIKATEGADKFDDFFNSNFAQAKRHGIARGAYHFFSTKSSAKRQAEYFCRMVWLEEGDLPPVLDVEVDVERSYGPQKLRSEVLTWLRIVEKHYGVIPIIYASYAYKQKYLDGKEFEKYPFWIAHYYVKELEYEGEWSFWQHTDVGEVDGINGYVDVDVFNGSSSEFEDLLLPDR